MPFSLLSAMLAAVTPVAPTAPAPPLIVDTNRADRAPVVPTAEIQAKAPPGATVDVAAQPSG